jgi:hypothetical protein
VLQVPRVLRAPRVPLPRRRVLQVPPALRAQPVLPVLLLPWVQPVLRARPVPLPAPRVLRVLPARPTPPTVAESKLALRNAGVM